MCPGYDLCIPKREGVIHSGRKCLSKHASYYGIIVAATSTSVRIRDVTGTRSTHSLCLSNKSLKVLTSLLLWPRLNNLAMLSWPPTVLPLGRTCGARVEKHLEEIWFANRSRAMSQPTLFDLPIQPTAQPTGTQTHTRRKKTPRQGSGTRPTCSVLSQPAWLRPLSDHAT